MNSDSRPTFIEIFMQMAKLLASRSTCTRLQVGCVITSTDYRYVYATGYNGSYSGGPNNCDTQIEGACGCLHAEDNATINCTVSRDTPKLLFSTHLPCVACAKRLINLGSVRTIYYTNDYRSDDSIYLLTKAEIHIQKV